MNKEFIPYEEALAMKELGFDEMYFGQYFLFEGESEPILCYDEDQYHIVKDNPNVKIETILSPTYSQAFRWFRDKYDEHHTWRLQTILSVEDYETYEEAELACLRKLIEIVNQMKDYE